MRFRWLLSGWTRTWLTSKFKHRDAYLRLPGTHLPLNLLVILQFHFLKAKRILALLSQSKVLCSPHGQIRLCGHGAAKVRTPVIDSGSPILGYCADFLSSAQDKTVLILKVKKANS